MIFKMLGMIIFIIIITNFFMEKKEKNKKHLETVITLKNIMSYLISEYSYSINTIDIVFKNINKNIKMDNQLKNSITNISQKTARNNESVSKIWMEESENIIRACGVDGVIDKELKGLAEIFSYIDKDVQIKAFKELEKNLIEFIKDLDEKYQKEKILFTKMQIGVSVLVVILCF